MPLDEHELAPATVLRGHVSPETAYLVEDYPYGYTLRCKIRYWLHTADRGAKRGQVRLMSQTTNPKLDGEPWNKPKGGTYYRWAVLIQDSRGHVNGWAVSEYGTTPWRHLAMRLRSVYSQLTDDERAGYDVLLYASIAGDRDTWRRAERIYDLIAEGVSCEEVRRDHGLYIDDRDYEIAAAAHAAGLKLTTS